MNKKILTLTLAASMFGVVFAAPDKKTPINISDELAKTAWYFNLLSQAVESCHKANTQPAELAKCKQLRRELKAQDEETRIAVFNTVQELDPKVIKIQMIPGKGFVKTTAESVAKKMVVGIIANTVFKKRENNE